MTCINRHHLLCILLALCAWTAHAEPLNPTQQTLYDIFKEMVETNTVHPNGDNTELAQKMAARLKQAGFAEGSRLRNDGIPTYGVSGIFVQFGEVRIHGRDERIPVSSLYEGQTFLYRLTKALCE